MNRKLLIIIDMHRQILTFLLIVGVALASCPADYNINNLASGKKPLIQILSSLQSAPMLLPTHKTTTTIFPKPSLTRQSLHSVQLYLSSFARFHYRILGCRHRRSSPRFFIEFPNRLPVRLHSFSLDQSQS